MIRADGRKGVGGGVALAAVFAAVSLCASGTGADDFPAKFGTVARNNDRANRDGTRSEGSCKTVADCNDGDACTADACNDAVCVNVPIADCVSCAVDPGCEAIDLVFVLDTSGSMRDEAAALCESVAHVIGKIEELGVSVQSEILGISEIPRLGFACVSDHVVARFGSDVPGGSSTCAFADGTSPYESWGPATAIVSDRYPWREGAVRMVVPIGDEGPCNGSFPDGCNDPGDDRDSIDNAIAVALAHDVLVSPITGTGSDACVVGLATALAESTGGQVLETTIPDLDLVVGLLRLVLGGCVPDFSCDDQRPCTENDTCRNGVCEGTFIPGCELCESVVDCEDFDACTDQVCQDGRCQWTANFDVANNCCDPADGLLTPLEDGDPCTADLCNGATGEVTHPAAEEGTPCDDGRNCTVNDTCGPEGVCGGEDVGFTYCASDADCFDHGCDADSGRCFCKDSPELCLTVVAGSLPNPRCFVKRDEVIVLVELASSDRTIRGGQFSIEFDTSVLRFVSVAPGDTWDPSSVFASELGRVLDESTGHLFYAVGVPLSGQGTREASVMAVVRFEALETCSETRACFVDDDQMTNTLVDDLGQAVSFLPCCPAGIVVNGSLPELTCPGSTITNADAGLFSAVVQWEPVSSSGMCDGPLAVVCEATHSEGLNVTHLLRSGGAHPLGTTEYSCRAEDACGASAECGWSVEVRALNSLTMDVQVDGMTFAGPATRCLEVELFSTCEVAPVVGRRSVQFESGGASLSLAVPIASYSCVSVRDPSHTLRSSAPLEIVDGRFRASFVGDAAAGGKSLRSGDLNDDGIVGPLDEELATNSLVELNPGPDSPCGTSFVHADLTGDGMVDDLDFDRLRVNFGQSDELSCCPEGTTGSTVAAGEQVTVRALKALGVKDARARDLNGDGVVTESELIRYNERVSGSLGRHVTK